MLFAVVSIALGVLLNLLGFIVSLRLDRHGIPRALNGQSSRRKRGTFPARTPRILINLVGQWIATGIAFVAVADLVPIAWPGLASLAIQLALIAVIDDAFFYWMHRWMHRNHWLYRTIHRRHHEAHAPVPLEYLYVHPAELAFGAVGMGVGFLAAYLACGGISAWSIWIYTSFRLAHELDIHSGMRLFTRHIPWLVAMRHHDLHHARPNRGNYASMFPWWDRWMKTRASAGG